MVSWVIVKLPHQTSPKGDHIPHEKKYNTRHGLSAIPKGTEWAVKRGISDGTNPTAPVTREQLAAMLYRFAGAPAVSGALNFNDANAVSEYARSALLWATQNGILNGVGGDLAAPAAPAERSGRDDAGALPAKRRLKPNPSRRKGRSDGPPLSLRPSAALSVSSYGKGTVRYDRCKIRAMAFAPSEYSHIFTHAECVFYGASHSLSSRGTPFSG